jgi:hypothetical protein
MERGLRRRALSRDFDARKSQGGEPRRADVRATRPYKRNTIENAGRVANRGTRRGVNGRFLRAIKSNPSEYISLAGSKRELIVDSGRFINALRRAEIIRSPISCLPLGEVAFIRQN